MNAQAEEMKGFVRDLSDLVGGSSKGKDEKSVKKVKSGKSEPDLGKSLEASKQSGYIVKKTTTGNAKEISPEDVIPFDEGEFKDF